MTDNPFDETAVEAAAKAMSESSTGEPWESVLRVNWDDLSDLSRKIYIVEAKAALTAACKSMKERGRARTIPNFVLLDGLKPDTATVTIFRHGE